VVDSTVSLPGVDKAVAELQTALEAGATAVALVGERGAGKSSAALKLARVWSKNQNNRAIFISIPRWGDDAAAVALVSAASQLDPKGSKLVPKIKSPRVPWEEKVELVAAALKDSQDTPILILDNPRLEPPQGNAQTLFSVEAYGLTQKLLGLSGVRKVVTLPNLASWVDAKEEVTLETRSVAAQVLQPSNWEGLAQHAQLLWKVGGTQLDGYSPFELRLMVALVAAGVKPVDILTNGWHHRELLRRLMFSLAGQGALKKVIGRLAILRGAFDEQFLALAGAGQLEAHSSALLRRALLFRENGLWVLHELLSREALEHDWLTDAEAVEAHQKAASYHQARFKAAAKTDDLTGALRHEMEYVHHLTEAGDVETLLSEKFSLFFSTQYDALGKSLSHKKHYDQAVRAYERAIEHNPKDWYGHHYLAYNLDILAQDPDRVEAEYTEALKWKPAQVWFHGRLICFLITTGRLLDARRAWGSALSRLLSDEASLRNWVYDELHRQVAWLLLHRGQLDFARRVLEDVPPSVSQTAFWYQNFTRVIRAQEEAEENKLVFPPSIPVEQRWEGPHLILDKADAARVEAWTPGRIASVDDRGVHIRIARRDPATGQERYGWRDLTNEQLRSLNSHAASLRLPAGTFIELITLRTAARRAKQELLLSHPQGRAEDFSLGPSLFPPPDRYIRSAFTSPTS
jgi:tetratricopeptide (TPR) repeat protein